MRPTLLSLTAVAALSLATLPSAALAQSGEPEVDAAVELLSDPAMQDGLADAMGAMVEAMMQVEIGPVAQAAARMDPDGDLGDIDPDATLGEVAGYDSDYDGARLDDEIRTTTRGMGAMAGSMAAMIPALKAMARDVEAQWRVAARRD